MYRLILCVPPTLPFVRNKNSNPPTSLNYSEFTLRGRFKRSKLILREHSRGLQIPFRTRLRCEICEIWYWRRSLIDNCSVVLMNAYAISVVHFFTRTATCNVRPTTSPSSETTKRVIDRTSYEIGISRTFEPDTRRSGLMTMRLCSRSITHVPSESKSPITFTMSPGSTTAWNLDMQGIETNYLFVVDRALSGRWPNELEMFYTNLAVDRTWPKENRQHMWLSSVPLSDSARHLV